MIMGAAAHPRDTSLHDCEPQTKEDFGTKNADDRVITN